MITRHDLYALEKYAWYNGDRTNIGEYVIYELPNLYILQERVKENTEFGFTISISSTLHNDIFEIEYNDYTKNALEYEILRGTEDDIFEMITFIKLLF